MTHAKWIREAVDTMEVRAGYRTYVKRVGLNSPLLFWKPINKIYVAFVINWWDSPLLYKFRLGGNNGYRHKIPKVGQEKLRNRTNTIGLGRDCEDIDIQVVVLPEELVEGSNLTIDIAQAMIAKKDFREVQLPFKVWQPERSQGHFYTQVWSEKATKAYHECDSHHGENQSARENAMRDQHLHRPRDLGEE
jgi:hypothetical protein